MNIFKEINEMEQIAKEINEMEQIVDEFAKCGRFTSSEAYIFHRIGAILRIMEDTFIQREVQHDNKRELEDQNESKNNN